MKILLFIFSIFIFHLNVIGQSQVTDTTSYGIKTEKIIDTICYKEDGNIIKAQLDFTFPKLYSNSINCNITNDSIFEYISSKTALKYLKKRVICNKDGLSNNEMPDTYTLEYAVALSNESLLWTMFYYEEHGGGGNGFFHPNFYMILDLKSNTLVDFKSLLIPDSIESFKKLVYSYSQNQWHDENSKMKNNGQSNLEGHGFENECFLQNVDRVFNLPFSINGSNLEIYFEIYSSHSNYSKPFDIPLVKCKAFFRPHILK